MLKAKLSIDNKWIDIEEIDFGLQVAICSRNSIQKFLFGDKRVQLDAEKEFHDFMWRWAGPKRTTAGIFIDLRNFILGESLIIEEVTNGRH